MKFNYTLYRPKKFISDIRKVNSSYFRAKDVTVTPLTKIGDADKLHRERTAGRLPTLARKLRPGQLTLAGRNRRSGTTPRRSRPTRIRIPVLIESSVTPLANDPGAAHFSLGAWLRQQGRHLSVLPGPTATMKPLALTLVVLATVVGIGSAQIVGTTEQPTPAGQTPPARPTSTAQRRSTHKTSHPQSTAVNSRFMAATTVAWRPRPSVAANSETSVRTSRGFSDSTPAVRHVHTTLKAAANLPAAVTPTPTSASAAATVAAPTPVVSSSTATTPATQPSTPTPTAMPTTTATSTPPATSAPPSTASPAPAPATTTTSPSTTSTNPASIDPATYDQQLLNQNVPTNP